MSTDRKRERPRRKTPAARISKEEAEDIALAEELIRESQKEHAAVIRESKKFLKLLGLEGRKPIGAKKLRERLIQQGFDPESTEFSRGIMEMREE